MHAIQVFKKYLLSGIMLFFVSFIFKCNLPDEINVEIKTCPKLINLTNIDLSDTGYTKYEIYHEGFCFKYIDTLLITKELISGKQKVYLNDTLRLAGRNLAFYQSSDNGTKVFVKLIEPDDTVETISGKMKAIYHNGSESNTIDFSYELPCKKEITIARTKLIDTMSCTTTAGPGDRYRIYIDHQGFCTNEIDSISGYGEFYSLDNYFWNSSSLIVTPDRISVADTTVFGQEVSFKICITYNYSDYIDLKFYCVYKDKTKSNTSKTRIFFNYGNKKSFRGKHTRQDIE